MSREMNNPITREDIIRNCRAVSSEVHRLKALIVRDQVNDGIRFTTAVSQPLKVLKS